jgi:hypothetical protein
MNYKLTKREQRVNYKWTRTQVKMNYNLIEKSTNNQLEMNYE